MARDQGPGVLGVGGALDDRLGEVARLRGERGERTEQRSRASGSGRRPRARARRRRSWRRSPPARPAYVLDGEMWVRNFVRPKLLADEVGARVVGPDRRGAAAGSSRARRRGGQRRAGGHDRRGVPEPDEEREERDVQRPEDRRHPGREPVVRVLACERRRPRPGRCPTAPRSSPLPSSTSGKARRGRPPAPARCRARQRRVAGAMQQPEHLERGERRDERDRGGEDGAAEGQDDEQDRDEHDRR